MTARLLNVLVVGATGSVGRQVVARAVARGHNVRALVREQARTNAAVRGLDPAAKRVTGDLTRAEILTGAVRGIDAVVFTHGSSGGSKPEAERVDYGAVLSILSALAGRRDVRIALMTSIGVTNRAGAYNRSTEMRAPSNVGNVGGRFEANTADVAESSTSCPRSPCMKALMTAAAIAAASVGAPSGAAEPAGETTASPRWQINRAGARPVNAAPEQNFTGSVKVEMLYTPATPERTSAGSVSFMPGARTAWHTHPLGQTLVVTAGVGRVQRDGGPVEEIHVGDVVHIPPNTRHWHGAAPDSAMTHIAITEARDGKSVDWLEKVSDAQYTTAPVPAALPVASPSQGQALFGDIAPKFGQLTDDVLFGDVWARPGLSPRDRSLITVSALIAMNRPDQLRGHMARARGNGVSDAELIELTTHLAFYAGWPSAVTSIGVARDVFKTPHP